MKKTPMKKTMTAVVVKKSGAGKPMAKAMVKAAKAGMKASMKSKKY